MGLGALHIRLGGGGEAEPREALASGLLNLPAPKDKALVSKICKPGERRNKPSSTYACNSQMHLKINQIKRNLLDPILQGYLWQEKNQLLSSIRLFHMQS